MIAPSTFIRADGWPGVFLSFLGLLLTGGFAKFCSRFFLDAACACDCSSTLERSGEKQRHVVTVGGRADFRVFQKLFFKPYVNDQLPPNVLCPGRTSPADVPRIVRNVRTKFKGTIPRTTFERGQMDRTNVDPRELYPKPPYSEDKQKPPGLTGLTWPRPDHGEEVYQGSGLLEGKRSLITGADSGIGRAVAIAFAREGADVGISFLSEVEDAERTARLVKECRRTAALLPGNLADKKACQTIAHEAVSVLGGIDILVNNLAFQRSYDQITKYPGPAHGHKF